MSLVAIPNRLALSSAYPNPTRGTVTFALAGLGLLATMPCLLKIPSVNGAFFSSVGAFCFAAGFLIYTTAVIRDLHEHGVL